MYKLRYGRTYNMGNYQSERIEVEQDFQDDTSIDVAMGILIKEIEDAHVASVAYLKQKNAEKVQGK